MLGIHGFQTSELLNNNARTLPEISYTYKQTNKCFIRENIPMLFTQHVWSAFALVEYFSVSLENANLKGKVRKTK